MPISRSSAAAFFGFAALAFSPSTSYGDAGAGCLPFAHCLPDKMYHPVALDPTGRYKNEQGNDAVGITTMYVNQYGWRAARPGEPGVTDSWRKTEFYKAFIEFNEDGYAFDSKQKEAIIAKLEALKATRNPVYLAIYIHGWHYNADDAVINGPDRIDSPVNAIKFDNFIARYADMTRRLYELNSSDRPPTIVGIYVGWRGESMDGWLATTTLGDRAAAADRLAGRRDERSLYRALNDFADKMRETHVDSRMIVFGHSLGGRILSMAFIKEIAGGKDYPLGKSVLLAAIEPAIGADCYDSIFLRPRNDAPGMVPSFITVTSKDDTAVGYWYPFSSWIPIVGAPMCNDGSDARRKTIGNYMSYLTHSLDTEHFVDTEVGEKADPSPYQADNKTLKYPLIDSVKGGVLKTDTTFFWRYPYFDGTSECGGIRSCYTDRDAEHTDAQYYTMTLCKRDAFAKVAAVWNVQADRDLIDMAKNSKKNRGDHNGYVSTSLTNFLVHMTYLQKEWSVPAILSLQETPEACGPKVQ